MADTVDNLALAIQNLNNILRGYGSDPGILTDVAILKVNVAQLTDISTDTIKSVGVLLATVTKLSGTVDSLYNTVAAVEDKGSHWAQVQFAGLLPDLVTQSEIRRAFIIPMILYTILAVLGFALGHFLR